MSTTPTTTPGDYPRTGYPDISRSRPGPAPKEDTHDDSDFEPNYDHYLDAVKFSKNSFKIDNIGILTGHENYDDWASSMTIVFTAMDCKEMIIDGMTPTSNATAKAKTNFRYLYNQALLLLIQSVSKPILRVIAKKRDPHEIWKYLKSTYYRDSPFSFVNQILNFTRLSYAYDPTKPVKAFIDRFEIEWEKLETLAKSEVDDYRIAFHTFLTNDKAKRDFFLAFIKTHHKNVVDNLTTKEDLSYSDVITRLHEMDDGDDVDVPDVALKTTTTKHGKKKAYKSDNSDKPKESDKKDCTYCRKHSPGRSSGHTWQDCRKLKADREKKTEDAKVMKEDTVSNPISSALHTTQSPTQSPTSWIFDTAASSHMTPLKDHFERLRPHRRTVRTGDSTPLIAEGIGSLTIDAILPDGSTNRVRINDVLYVPSLCCSLFSWRAVCKKGVKMVAEGRKIELWRQNDMILEAEMNGNLFHIREKNVDIALATTATAPTSTMTFDHWHAALGHAAPTAMRRTDLYADGHLIPTPSTSFHCEACTLAKSTHKVPASITHRATRPLELIHTDLSGSLSQRSLGGSEYYISFIEDYTRYT